MNAPVDLKAIAAAEGAAPPFGFEEFERRATVVARQRRATAWSVAGSLSVLSMVSLLAVLTQAPEPVPEALVASGGTAYDAPALVDMDQLAVTSDLQDYIALIDAEISAARVSAVPAEQVQRLQVTRDQLTDSLQRVSYAHAVLSY